MCILMTEMCERLTYYSVVANLVLFCTSTLKYSSNDATTISLVFSGSVYLIPVFGGCIADGKIGMFNTTYGFSLIYLLGLFLLPASAVDYKDLFGGDEYELSVEHRRIYFMLGLVFAAIGTGGIKAPLATFGPQQVQDMGPAAVQTFFNWYTWFANAGALIAYSGVAVVQQNVSFSWGFFIPLLSMLLGIVSLQFARRHYIHKQLTGGMIRDSFIVCFQGCCPPKGREKQQTHGFFDTARIQHGGSYDDKIVDGVIAVLRVLPIFFLLTMYWAVYSQIQTTFFLQGERMDLNVGKGNVPVAILNVFNTISVMLLIPVMDRVLYPCMERLGHPLSHLHKIGIGMVVAASSMIVAAVLEIERKKQLGFQQVVGSETFNASYISVFAQIPQFALVGASEAFVSVSGLEFAYTQSPESMQGVMMGVYLASAGLGSYLSTAILKIVEETTVDDPWLPDEMNNGHAEYLFYLLAGLMGVFFLGFLLVAKKYNKNISSNRHIDTEMV
ncbi:solute carrier family 15 member 4-like isoform X1 [Pomacea canaliculata]|uniref:solute carrier family 15 member 4-like isoform X1 n=1 Tax=Pomacea canaliculata TaxID=400727 RepID=UPI000D72A1CA|nr:solute carrier family 15 member 4-like isoform X1 [Pomacea canaliculata]